MPQLNSLFQPIKVGGLELKNRIVMTVIETGYSPDGQVTDRLKDFYAARAKGGVGLIICRVPSPYVEGRQPGLTVRKDSLIRELRQFAEAIHAHGGKVGAQLCARLMWAKHDGAPRELVGPSDFAPPRGGRPVPQPRPLSIEEIEQITEEKAIEAEIVREAGFDMVEIHAHGGRSLPSQFLSPLTNHRTDRYGGSLENRYRFLLEQLDKARSRAGEDFPITCRISGADFLEGGCTMAETKIAAPMLERAGFCALDVTTGWHEAPVPFFQASVSPGAFVYLAEEVKKVVNIPVIGGSRVADPVLADKLIADGRVDMVFMARALMADPELTNKAREGRLDEVCPCFACNYCWDVSRGGVEPIACALNALVGRETEWAIEPASTPKKVLVVGGGPAGMEAARVAALRGHQVTLVEKRDRLGGNLNVAAIPPFKEEIARVISYYAGQMELQGIEVQLNREATVDSILQGKPDVVILASGASSTIPDIPGVQGHNVATAEDVLTGARETGDRVIIIGGGMVGCETAEFLAEKGKRVTLLEMLDRIGNDVGSTYRWVVMSRLKQADIRMEAQAKAEEITETGVRSSRNGSTHFFEGDTVVLAVGLRPNDLLYPELQGRVPSVYSIGDCVSPRRVAEAVHAAFKVAREI